MADTSLAVTKAAIALLSADITLQPLVSGRVYTDVPEAADFPYLVVSLDAVPFAASDFSGQTHTLTVQAYSRKATVDEVCRIRKAAIEALDRRETAIGLDEGTLVMCQYAGSLKPFQEDDGKTWQAVGELELTVV